MRCQCSARAEQGRGSRCECTTCWHAQFPAYTHCVPVPTRGTNRRRGWSQGAPLNESDHCGDPPLLLAAGNGANPGHSQSLCTQSRTVPVTEHTP